MSAESKHSMARLALASGSPRRLALLQQIGLEPLYADQENPFPWMSEMIDLKKERNFFETRVIEYQSGGALSWD